MEFNSVAVRIVQNKEEILIVRDGVGSRRIYMDVAQIARCHQLASQRAATGQGAFDAGCCLNAPQKTLSNTAISTALIIECTGS